MIDLREQLSEYSYGHGVTKEAQSLLEFVGLRPTPYLPNLVKEGNLGFDVRLKDRGCILILQFKLGHELSILRKQYPRQAIPKLSRPFWRFNIDIEGNQFLALREQERSRAQVFYIAPKFSDWMSYENYFQAEQILENSLIIKPSDIEAGAERQNGQIVNHRVVYDRSDSYVCSEPTQVESFDPICFADHVRQAAIASEGTFGEQLERLYEQDRSASLRESATRVRQTISTEGPDAAGSKATAVSNKIWSQGGQIMLVSYDATKDRFRGK